MENLQQNYDMPKTPRLPAFPTGKREFLFLLLILVASWLLCNSVLFAGLNLGFAIFAGCAILLSAGYLLCHGGGEAAAGRGSGDRKSLGASVCAPAVGAAS